MPTMNQRSAAKAQKARKKKITAAALGGILLLAIAIQGPKTLKMLHGSSPSQPAATSASSSSSTATTAPVATPSAATQIPSTASATSVTSMQDSDLPPARKRTQLLSFDTFDSKDPFVQQVTEETAPTSVGTASSVSTSGVAPDGSTTSALHIPAGGTAGATTAAASSQTGTSSSSSTNTPTRSTAQAGSRLTAAVVDVNGKQESVGVAAAFPKANPTFKLVSLSNGVAKIGLAGGNYASGAQTVALRLGHTLTLVNTSDGMRYELRLVSAR